MSYWIITSWVFVALLTGVNVFLFLKLKTASEQMLQMAFPGAKDMNDAMSRMQQMMGGMAGARGPMPGGRGGACKWRRRIRCSAQSRDANASADAAKRKTLNVLLRAWGFLRRFASLALFFLKGL